MAPLRGFLLTPTYRLSGGAPVVHLHGILETGEPCLLLDDRVRPYFFIPLSRLADARRAARGLVAEETEQVTFAGDAVARVTVTAPGEVPALRQKLERVGIECFEADVRFTTRYLIDRGLRGSFEVEGPFDVARGVGRVYRNPELRPARWAPVLRVLSLDIETSPRGDVIYSIAFHMGSEERVLIVHDRPVAGAEDFTTEEAMLRRFLALVREWDPDVLSGWNVVDFDLAVLQRRCHQHGLRCALGRTEDEIEIRRDASFTRESRALLQGRLVLDGLSLVRGAFIRLEDYKLETAAQTFLGRGKLFTGDGRHRQIEAAYREDPESLVAYNLLDAKLVSEILVHTHLIELAVQRSMMTGMPLDRVSAAIASVDSLYLAETRRRGVVTPSVSSEAKSARLTGGYVMDSVAGLYRNILVFDFKSLYPSIIRTFNIDPLTFVAHPTPDTPAVRAPNGAHFRREPRGILPELVARLAQERAEAKRAGDPIASNAVKILMNSMYGVLGSGASRLFAPQVANAITGFGQHLIQFAADCVRARGLEVIYGDTDSLFVHSRADDAGRATALAEDLRQGITAEVARHVRERYGCESFLELEFETLYARFFMPELRGGKGGSKKRYAGLIEADGADEIEFVGLESVRRDWTEVSKRLQHGLLDRVFHDQPVEDFVRHFVGRLRAGELDQQLVYKKAVRKALDAYTKTTPPHVRAARLAANSGRIVEYVMTAAGPEPAGEVTAPLDYDHYLEHQLKPVAEAILRFVGADFDELTGRKKQLSLF
jgi:DNA polymerase II